VGGAFPGVVFPAADGTEGVPVLPPQVEIPAQPPPE